MNTQSEPAGQFSEKDNEILAHCRKIMASRFGQPGLRHQWMLVFPIGLPLIHQILDWNPIFGPIALCLASVTPFLFYQRHLQVRLRELSDLALRLAEKVTTAGPTGSDKAGPQGNGGVR